MAGLGRIQQRFNAAIVGTLAALVGFARGGSSEAAEEAAAAGSGHPLHRKLITRSNPRGNTPGYDFPGYCAGLRYNANGNGKRRVRGAAISMDPAIAAMLRQSGVDMNDNAAVRRALEGIS